MNIILIFFLWLLWNFSDLLLCILLWTSTQALLRLSIRFINFETLSNSQFLWIALQFYFFSILVFDMWMLVGIPFTVIFSFSLWLALYYTISYIIELLNASEASSNANFFQYFSRYWVREGFRCVFGGKSSKEGASMCVGEGYGLKGGARDDPVAPSDADFQVPALRQNLVGKKSRGIYGNSMVKFLIWLLENKPELVDPEFALSASAARNKRAFIKKVLHNAPNNPPINFQLLTAPDFMDWIVTVRKRDGERPGSQSYSSHRTGLFNLFRSFRVTMSTELQSELSNHYKGLKRTVASAIAAGGGKIKSGKDPLAFSLYLFLGLELLVMDSRESVFARTFMILAWNLIARASNTFHVCLNHMEWVEDALAIYFSQMKNDQFAERPRDPRHIYANPLHPEICGILALAIYWCCYNFEDRELQLFPGNNQYERFRKILSRMVLLEGVAEELEHRAIDPESLGTHSMRKGASTFGASGSTACPPSAALQLRGGWKLGGVLDTYLRYESAGDMYVGRTVSGLPIDQPEFAILPPNFEGADTAVIKNSLCLVFPALPKYLNRVGEFAMASLVYHYKFLQDTLPITHPLFESALFRNKSLYIELKDLVKCELSHEGSSLKGTGIPPHVSILSRLAKLEETLNKTIQLQNENIKRIIDGVMAKLEEKAVGLGTVTEAGVERTVMKCLEVAGVMRVLSSIENPPAATHTAENPAQPSPSTPMYTWGGKLHYFPEDFCFPKGTVLEAWRYWCLGDSSRGYPPLKRLTSTPQELATRNLCKRLSDFKYLMNKIEAHVCC